MHLGEIYNLVVRLDPMDPNVAVSEPRAAGESVADALTYLGLDAGPQTQVLLNDTSVAVGNRAAAVVKAGDTLTITPTPEGTFNLSQGISALSHAFANTAHSIGHHGSLAMLSHSSNTVILSHAIGTIGINIGASLLLSGITGGDRPEESGFEPVRAPYITATANIARPYETVPVVLGEFRITPPLGARSHNEVTDEETGDANHHALVVWGHAPLEVDDIRLGTLLPDEFNATVESDLQGSGTLVLPERKDTDLYITPLFDSSDGGSVGWVNRQTPVEASNFTVKIGFQMGGEGVTYREVRDSGQAITRTVKDNGTATVEVEYRPANTNQWTTLTKTFQGYGDSRFNADFEFTVDGGPDPDSTETPPARLPLPLKIYDVRFRVVSIVNPPRNSAVLPQETWTLQQPNARLEKFESESIAAPVNVTGVAMSSVLIEVDARTSGVTSEINGVVKSLTPVYNPATKRWSDREADYAHSTNPADLFRYVMTSDKILTRPLPVSAMDDDNLGEWWEFCRDEGFTYSHVIQGTETRQDLIGDIARAGRALPRLSNGKWGVTSNKIIPQVTQLFTPRNSWGFAQVLPLVEKLHAYRVHFANKEANWEQDERVVYADGYSKSNAKLFRSIQLHGLTDPDAVYKIVRYLLATQTLRPWVISITIGVESLRAEPGDRVRVQHEAGLIGQTAGRIKEVNTSSTGLSYGAWERSDGSVNAPSDFLALSISTTPHYGFFTEATTSRPTGTSKGVYAAWESGNKQVIIAAAGNGAASTKFVRTRTRDPVTGVWGAWVAWSSNTTAYESNDFSRVGSGNSKPPALIQLSDSNGPSDVGSNSSWAVIEDAPHGNHTLRQRLYQYHNDPYVWTRNVSGATGTVSLVLDEEVTLAAGKSYAMTVMQFNGQAVTLAVTAPSGPTHIVTVDRVSGVQAGNLFAFGEIGLETKDCLITAIEPGNDMEANLTLIPYAPEVFNAAAVIPPFVSTISRPITPTYTGPRPPRITTIVSDESALPVDAGPHAQPTMLVNFVRTTDFDRNTRVTQPTQTVIEWRRADAAASDRWNRVTVEATAGSARLTPVETGVAYDVRAFYLDANKGISVDSNTVRHTVVGLVALPPNVTSFVIDPGQPNSTIRWNYQNDVRDLAGFRLWWASEGGITDTARMIQLDALVPGAARSWQVPSINGSYAIKAYDARGNFSAQARYIDATHLTPTPVRRAVETLTEHPAFSGTKENTAVYSSALQLERMTSAGNTAKIKDWPALKSLEHIYREASDGFPVGISAGRYTTRVVDLGESFSVALTADVRLDPPVAISGSVGNASTLVRVQARYATSLQDGTYNWSHWRDVVDLTVSARYIQYRLVLGTDSANVTPSVKQATFTASAGQRRLSGADVLSVGNANTSVSFTPAFELDASTSPASPVVVNLQGQDLRAGERTVVESKSRTGFSFSVRDADNERVGSRLVDWEAVGYGTAT